MPLCPQIPVQQQLPLNCPVGLDFVRHSNKISFGVLPGKVFCQTQVSVFILQEKVPRVYVYPFQPETKLIQLSHRSYVMRGLGLFWHI